MLCNTCLAAGTQELFERLKRINEWWTIDYLALFFNPNSGFYVSWTWTISASLLSSGGEGTFRVLIAVFLVPSWLFEGLGRDKAEELLQLPDTKIGSFMIRESETKKGEQPWTHLSMRGSENKLCPGLIHASPSSGPLPPTMHANRPVRWAPRSPHTGRVASTETGALEPGRKELVGHRLRLWPTPGLAGSRCRISQPRRKDENTSGQCPGQREHGPQSSVTGANHVLLWPQFLICEMERKPLPCETVVWFKCNDICCALTTQQTFSLSLCALQWNQAA